MTEARVSGTDHPADWQRRDGGWWLVASRCDGCANHAYPAADHCHRCGAEGPLPRVPIPARGRVYTHTRVHTAPAGFPTPYTLAYVDLDDGPRVLGRLAEEPPTPAIGDQVLAVPRVIGHTAQGEPLHAPYFVRQEG
ncbi:Zn-ribbon domain-containing OB-fold protein [Streptomyces sp. NBRC 109706]|uniref:Zn-ribbon domain-containing OB-fold protein n=1 Tax=Streptomyces sp. NBRC 109706 TaxID=1550035 RepID=UPI0007837E64|nr:OB-fold domain-containing protein [Streptomyces sp. NBRC 109706]